MSDEAPVTREVKTAARALIGVVALVVLFVIGAVVGIGAASVLDQRPAFRVNRVFAADSVTTLNGRIQIYQSLTKLRNCSIDVSRWIWTWVNYHNHRVKLFIPLAESPALITGQGEGEGILSFPVPRGAFDATWYYYERSEARCNRFLSAFTAPQVSVIDNVPIRIVTDHEPTNQNQLVTPWKLRPDYLERSPL